jgi:hypothetical protein
MLAMPSKTNPESPLTKNLYTLTPLDIDYVEPGLDRDLHSDIRRARLIESMIREPPLPVRLAVASKPTALANDLAKL